MADVVTYCCNVDDEDVVKGETGDGRSAIVYSVCPPHAVWLEEDGEWGDDAGGTEEGVRCL